MSNTTLPTVEVLTEASTVARISVDQDIYSKSLIDCGASPDDISSLSLTVEPRETAMWFFDVREAGGVKRPTLVFSEDCVGLSPEQQGDALRHLTGHFITYLVDPEAYGKDGRAASYAHVLAGAAVAGYAGYQLFAGSTLGHLPLGAEITVGVSAVSSPAIVGASLGQQLSSLDFHLFSRVERQARRAERDRVWLPNGVLEITKKI